MIQINAQAARWGQASIMMRDLHWLGDLCSSAGVLQGGLLVGLLVAGAAGSVVHCGPMCGVFVLGQVSERMAAVPAARLCEWRRVGNGLLLPYHLGRLTTYAGLGAVAAASASVFGQRGWFGWLSAGLLVVAALLFAGKGLGGLVPWTDRVPQFGVSRFWVRLIRGFTRRIDRGSVAGEYLLGVALGFLPCGFLYAAIAAAAATGRAEMGAAAMVAFGLGTVPVLAVIGVAGHAAGRHWNRRVAALAPALMLLNAGLLLVLAWQRLT